MDNDRLWELVENKYPIIKKLLYLLEEKDKILEKEVEKNKDLNKQIDYLYDKSWEKNNG